MSEAIPEPVARWLEDQTALSFLLWVAAVWATLTLAWKTVRKMIPALKSLIALSESLERLPAWMDDTDDRLDEIRHEVLPNKGGSLRDDVVTVSLQVEQMAARQQENIGRVDELEQTITRRLDAREKAHTAPIILPPKDSEES